MKVRYRTIEENTAYRVGTDGSVWTRYVSGVRCKKSGRIMPARVGNKWRRMKTKGAYPQVSIIRDDGRLRQVSVHTLVLEAFVGPRPKGKECCHFPDRNPSNCNLGNLRWDYRNANREDARIHGTLVIGSKSHSAKLTEESVIKIRTMAATGNYLHDTIAKIYGVSRRNITRIIAGERWRHAGGPVSKGNKGRRNMT
jgi:hypothetical protein